MIWHDRPGAAPNEINPEQELELRLSAQARAGAGWALSALVARYQPPVVRLLVRLTGSQQTAYALAEQVFVRMGKRLRGPQGGNQLRLWLLRAATEAGLDAIRHPAARSPRRLAAAAGPAGLLPGVVAEPHVARFLTALGIRPPTRAADHEAPSTQEFVWQMASSDGESPDADPAQSDGALAREQVRQRLIRAVLAELPYGDAQCLALHLVAGLNQGEVAQALGVADLVVRRRIVQGLQLFARRYEATLESLGLRPDEPEPETLPGVDGASVVDAPSVLPEVSDAAVASGDVTGDATGDAQAAPPEDQVAPAGAAPIHESMHEPAHEPHEPLEMESALLVVESGPLAEPAGHADTLAARAPSWTTSPRAAEVYEHAVVVVEADPGPPAHQPAAAPAASAADAPRQAPVTRPVAAWVETETAVLPEEAADLAGASESDADDGPDVDPDDDAAYFAPVAQPAPVTRPLTIPVPETAPEDAEEPADEAAALATDALAVVDAAEDAAAPIYAAEAEEHSDPGEEPPIADEGAPVPVLAGRDQPARLRRVLSADGEAEDPGDDAVWPVR